jgi:hypothetical protein
MPTNEPGMGRRALNGLMGMLPRPGNVRDWRQIVDMATNTIIPGDWWNSQERRMNGPLEAFGLHELFRGGVQPTGTPPTYLDPNTPGAPTTPGPNPQWNGAPGQQPQGQGALMGYQAPRPRNIRPGGGQVIAEGQDAQNMVEGMRESSTGQLNRQAQEIYRRMYRGQEF